MASVELSYNHRAALALNNMAVRLMQRRQYVAASETFLDSMNVLKQCFPQSEQSFNNNSIIDKLKKAEQRVCNMAKLDSDCVLSSCMCILPQNDVDILSLRKHVLQYGLDSAYLYPIYLELLESVEEKCSDRALTVDVTIILYNYGTLNMCKSSSGQQNQGHTNLSVRRALSLLEYAHSIFVNQIDVADIDETCNEKYTLVQFLLTRGLYQVYSDLNLHCQMTDAHKALTDVWEYIDQSCKDLEFQDMAKKPMGAPAA
jgi:hypothetical protein